MLKPKILRVYQVPPKLLKGKIGPMQPAQMLSLIANVYEEKAKADRWTHTICAHAHTHTHRNVGFVYIAKMFPLTVYLMKNRPRQPGRGTHAHIHIQGHTHTHTHMRTCKPICTSRANVAYIHVHTCHINFQHITHACIHTHAITYTHKYIPT
jgi:hypothetical protein